MIKRIIVFGVILGFGAMLGTTAAQDLTPMEELGKAIFFDKISSPDWMSCAQCHAPSVGWTGPIPGINQGGAVYRGVVPPRQGFPRTQPLKADGKNC